MSWSAGFLTGLACGVAATGLVAGAVAVSQPIKTRPKPEEVSWESVPAKIKSYLAKQAPGIEFAEIHRFATGEAEIYELKSKDTPIDLQTTITNLGVMLHWNKFDSNLKAEVPDQVKEHFRQAMPEARFLGFNDHDTVQYLYSAVAERDGKCYRLTLSAIAGVEIEELSDWQADVYRRQEQSK